MMKFMQMAVQKLPQPSAHCMGAQDAQQVGSQAQSKDEKLARKRASKALSNAKQRCSNPKDPEYPNYGAVGIAVLINSADELIACIGLPQPGQSLDRIDPNGHYQAGNVRWASPAVQSVNKKLSPLNAHLSVPAQVAQAKLAVAQKQNRAGTTEAWSIMRRGFLHRHLSQADVDFLAGNVGCSGALECAFDLNTVPDWANHVPGFVHLPALSLPNARVRLRGISSNPCLNAANLDRAGRWIILEGLDPNWNIPPVVWERSLAALSDGQLGLTLTGRPTPEALLGGWVEGSLLALASCIPQVQNMRTVFRPMMSLARDLLELGSPATWDEVEHPVLDGDVLLVPDFCLDCGAWGEFPQKHWWRVNLLLEHRIEQGMKTIVGVQDVSKLPAAVKEIVLGAFSILSMPSREPHERTKLQFSSTDHPIPTGGRTLRSLAADGTTSHLVKHFGLPGS